MKARPVVVLTRDQVVNSIGSVVVCIVTRTVRGLPSEVPIGRTEGLPVPSVANLDNILTVPRARLLRRMGALNDQGVQELDRAIRFSLGLS